MAAIASIQVGLPITEGDPAARDLLTRRWTTGFYKAPVERPVRVLQTRLEGDGQADLEHHGGIDKAILGYAASHYPAWRESLGLPDLPHGAFGENLTIAGQTEASVCIGDRYAIGDVLLELSQPRQPCWKLARRWGIKTLTKQVAQTGRGGWYFRVLQTGIIQAGNAIELVDRPHPDWSVKRADDILFGREVDRAATMELMQIPQLSAAWRADIL